MARLLRDIESTIDVKICTLVHDDNRYEHFTDSDVLVRRPVLL